MNEASGFLANINRMVDRAFDTLGLPPGLVRQIRETNSVYKVNFPVELDACLEFGIGY